LEKNTSFFATAIGSLPHKNPEEAVNLIFETFSEIPVLPQLAKMNPKEDMTSQLNEKIPGVIFDEEDKRCYMDQDSETFYEDLEEFFLDYESIVGEGNPEMLDKYAISEERCSSTCANPSCFCKRSNYRSFYPWNCSCGQGKKMRFPR